jgi:hypothetical protein
VLSIGARHNNLGSGWNLHPLIPLIPLLSQELAVSAQTPTTLFAVDVVVTSCILAITSVIVTTIVIIIVITIMMVFFS